MICSCGLIGNGLTGTGVQRNGFCSRTRIRLGPGLVLYHSDRVYHAYTVRTHLQLCGSNRVWFFFFSSTAKEWWRTHEPDIFYRIVIFFCKLFVDSVTDSRCGQNIRLLKLSKCNANRFWLLLFHVENSNTELEITNRYGPRSSNDKKLFVFAVYEIWIS
jgi:hypothetical protein